MNQLTVAILLIGMGLIALARGIGELLFLGVSLLIRIYRSR